MFIIFEFHVGFENNTWSNLFRDFEADSNFPEKSHCMDIAEWLIYGESGQNTNVRYKFRHVSK